MRKRKEIFLTKIVDGNDGLIYVAEATRHIPFPIKRVYFIDKLGPSSLRGFHAHKKLKQVIMCLRGFFDLEMYKDRQPSSNPVSAGQALLIPPMVWHSMKGFSRDCLIAVFASEHFKESDYIRSFHEFRGLQ